MQAQPGTARRAGPTAMEIAAPASRWKSRERAPRGGRPGLLALPILVAALAVAALAPPSLSAEGKIMRPVDGAAIKGTEIKIVASAPGGRLELDGETISPQEPFKGVFHATVKASPGRHTVALVWEGGREEARIFLGEGPPAEFKPFFHHPPLADVDCMHCHGVSRRGRFRFEGGCFSCHRETAFSAAHEHPAHQLEECGMCHNAHGETAKALLTMPKEILCKQCHN